MYELHSATSYFKKLEEQWCLCLYLAFWFNLNSDANRAPLNVNCLQDYFNFWSLFCLFYNHNFLFEMQCLAVRYSLIKDVDVAFSVDAYFVFSLILDVIDWINRDERADIFREWQCFYLIAFGVSASLNSKFLFMNFIE